MIKMNIKGFVVLLFLVGFLSIITAKETNATDPHALVTKSRITIESFMADPKLHWFHEYAKGAHALFIVPQLLKGAFFIGGSGGSGVFLVRNEDTGKWSQPAFYTMGSGSFGFQFGGHSAEVVLLVMSSKGIQPFFGSSFKLGAEASGAVGPVGSGIEGATAYNLSADYISFSRTKGAFLGFSFEGAVIAARGEWNKIYYGTPVSPRDIFMKQKVNNPHSSELVEAVSKATK
jgi:lipid-binding SYLF domain-containing protein